VLAALAGAVGDIRHMQATEFLNAITTLAAAIIVLGEASLLKAARRRLALHFVAGFAEAFRGVRADYCDRARGCL
jgi:hypothetical protein